MDELILLGRKIAELRNHRNLTQEELAELVNYSANHIAKLESARTNPSFDLLVKIAKALDIQVKDLFDYEERNTESFMIQELLKTINTSDTETIRLLYNFKKFIVDV